MEIINVTDEIIEVNVTEEVINIVTQTGGYPLPSNVFSVFGRTGNVVATEGDYSFTQLSGVTITTPTNGQVLKYNGTQWVNQNDPLTGYVPYIGATTDLDLGTNDLKTNKVFLLDEANDNYGSIHYSDGDFHIEDADGHKLLVIEDGFMQLHLTDTIQSNLYTTLLTQTRDHYLPNASGTLALTSDISYPVTSVFGRTGAVVATSGDYTTTQVTEGTRLYYTDARARAAISLTTTGTSGASTYNNTTGVLNIPQYQAALTNPVTGTGTTNTLAKFTGTSAIGNSNITDTGTLITLGSDTNINGFTSGTITKVLPAGNTFGSIPNGGTINLTGSANGWALISRQTFNVNDDAFTYNGLTANDTRILVNRSTTSSIGYQVYSTQIQNSGTATQNVQYGVYSGFTGGSGNFSTVVIYKVGSTGPQSNTNTYTNYNAFKAEFLPNNIANYVGISLNDYTATTTTRALDLNISAGTNKYNIYAGGTANNYMAGSLGIGATGLTGYSLNITKNITGATTAYGVQQIGSVQSDVTSSAFGFLNQINTQAASFTLGAYYHFTAGQLTIGAGSSVTTQIGFEVTAGLVGATNNFGFRGLIPSGTNRWNLYMQGTADNYLAGSLGIGVTSLTGVSLNVGKSITGAVDSTGINQQGLVLSDVTSSASGFFNQLTTQAASFSLTTYFHYRTAQGTIGAGSSIGTQIGFHAGSNLVGGTNNYGFRGAIPSGTNRWNLYMDGTAANYLAGDTAIGTTSLGTATMFTLGGTETAVSGVGRGQLINTTLVASANNDVMYGLDINPTYNSAGFTGVGFAGLRIVPRNLAQIVLGGTSQAGEIGFARGSDGTIQSSIGYSVAASPGDFRIRSGGGSGTLSFELNAGRYGQFFATTGNFHLQNGGTYTDIPTARLAVNSTTQGFLPPRMTAAQRGAISSPATGLMVYQTDGTEGVYVYTSIGWKSLTMV